MSEKKKYTEKKRKRNESENKAIKNEFNEEDIPDKKYPNSAEPIKKNVNMKEINNFMGRRKTKTNFEEKEKIKGEDLIFKERTKKALFIINKINTKINKEKNIELIENALAYDNTNKYVIYKSLKYFYEIKDKNKFNEIIDIYKFCITKKIAVDIDNKNKIINLENYYKINNDILEYEELEGRKKKEKDLNDLRNQMVDIFSSYYHISNEYRVLYDIMDENDINYIFKIKYESYDNNTYYFNYENEKKQKILEKYKIDIRKPNVLDYIQNFFCYYLFIKQFDYFEHNQPITYNRNLTLYYNYIIYSLYENVTEVNEKESLVKFIDKKIWFYISLQQLHNLIFDNIIDKQYPIDSIIDQLIRLLLLALSCKTEYKSFYELVDYIHLEKYNLNEEFMTEDDAKIIVNKNKKYKVKCIYDNIIFRDIKKNENESIIKYTNYSKSLLNYREDIFDSLYKNVNYEKFQSENFFQNEDIQYLKILIGHILSSKLFKQIFEHFNEINEYCEYYFSKEENLNDFVNNIIFLPFSCSNFEIYGEIDKKSLVIFLSGFPQKQINYLIEYLFYRIIELSFRVLVILHESAHYLNSGYCLISNGKITRNTSSSNDAGVEAGFFLEEVLFGWVHNSDAPLYLSSFNLPSNILIKNKDITMKKINLPTALVLLDPETYNYDLVYFRKRIFEADADTLQNFKFENLNQDYKNFLSSIINEETIKHSSEIDISINASMNFTSLFLTYSGTNHNLK